MADNVDKCPRCSSTDRSVRKEVFSDSSLYDFRECPHHWHKDSTVMFKPTFTLTPEIKDALDRERIRLGTVNPQYSYYERLAIDAQHDESKLHTLHSYIVKHGGFSGL